MAQQSQPQTLLNFSGVVTVENPINSPQDSSSHLHNLRILPGNYIRQWGGTKARYYETTTGEWQQFHEYRDPTYAGYSSQMGQWKTTSGPVIKWRWFSLVSWATSDIITINGSYDGGFSASNPAAKLNLRNRVIIYNGLGVRDGTNSRPPFSVWIPSVGEAHYFGLDAVCPGGTAPSVGTTGSSGITVLTHIKVWAGLYNSRSVHYSNAVYCGKINPGTYASIDVANLDRLAPAYNTSIEQSDLYYVFYFSIDGGDVGYLMMDSTLYAPDTLAVTSTSKSFSVVAPIIDGGRADLTKEAPTRNHPPRPMRWLASVNGRTYGALMTGGASGGSWNDGFSYSASSRFFAGIVYSETQGPESELLGSPEECWPPDNFSACPSSEIPMIGVEEPGENSYRLFVICPTSCWFVEEAADGIHEWTRVSRHHGVRNTFTVVETDYGVVWVNQRNEICILKTGSTSVEVLSGDYQTLFSGKTTRFATYTLDPLNHIDRYEVYLTDGTGIAHDFARGGQGNTFTGNFKAGKTLTSALDLQYHVLAGQHIYTQAGQPEDGLEKVRTETFTGLGTSTKTAINGVLRTQYKHFGDPSIRKLLTWFDVGGDVGNITARLWADFSDITSTAISTQSSTLPQRRTLYEARFKLVDVLNGFYFMLELALAGVASDSFDTHKRLDQYGKGVEAGNFLGLITKVDFTAGMQMNR